MKPVTALFLFSFAATGAACSDTANTKAEPAVATADEADVTSVATGPSSQEIGGTLNLNIGQRETGGSRMIGSGGLGQEPGQQGLIIGSGGLGGGNFGEAPDLGIDLVIDEDPVSSLSLPQSQDPAEADDIIRLPD